MNAVRIETDAPKPYMHPDVAPQFNELRRAVRMQSGVDFLARCGDVLRDPDFHSSKDGVAERSWHKTGRAFDYDQSSPHFLFEKDIIGGRVYFRTFIICALQNGTQGTKRQVRDFRGQMHNKYVVDFTALAEKQGFHRIPAWRGWETHYNRREFWHYQKDDGLTWEAAMQQIRSADTKAAALAAAEAKKYIGLNDRDSNTGGRVSQVETRLVFYKFLAPEEKDGTFDADTLRAVRGFQAANGLKQDGIVGPLTWARLMA
jgi:hypothetical protein